MSGVRHTPGPWTAVSGMSQMVSGDTTVVEVCPAIDDEPGWWVFSPADTHGDRAADARLIAAAPELYEALQALHDDIADYARINNLGGFDNHAMKRARAALAKATGTAS